MHLVRQRVLLLVEQRLARQPRVLGQLLLRHEVAQGVFQARLAGAGAADDQEAQGFVEKARERAQVAHRQGRRLADEARLFEVTEDARQQVRFPQQPQRVLALAVRDLDASRVDVVFAVLRQLEPDALQGLD
ncbi:MAG: hypothetical protein Q9Q13_00680 [Acidobacteriota bacterium]|nr:hypothetical protein [Acidobacteriota bacterium]